MSFANHNFKTVDFKALFGFLFISGMLLGICLYASELPKKQSTWGTWMTHTHIVIAEIENLEGQIAEAEAEQRGYLLTQDKSNMESYHQAVKKTHESIARLRKLTSDNPTQQERLSELDESLTRHFLYLDSLIKRHDASFTGYKKDSIYVMSFNERKNETDPIIMQMRTEEDKLLMMRTHEWETAFGNSKTGILLIVIILYIVLCTTYLLALRELKERKRLTRLAQKSAEAEKMEAARLTEIVQMQAEIAAHHMNLDAAMQLIANHTKTLTHADGSVIEELDGDFLVYKAISPITKQNNVGTRIPLEGSLCGMCVQQKSVLICNDTETDERVNREMCRQLGIRSMVVVPLYHYEEPKGVIKVFSDKISTFSEKDIATLELMAQLLSATIADAQATRTLKEANEKLAALATTDGLTGIKNHRTFKETLSNEYDRSRRYNHELSVILLDVDHFKTFNDTYGHPAGDIVLKEVADLVKKSARDCDFIARYGGEEFAVMLPETNTDGAMFVAERIRQTIANTKWAKRAITVSVGVCTLNEANTNYSSLIDSADKALYASKSAGRNKVTLFDEDLAA